MLDYNAKIGILSPSTQEMEEFRRFIQKSVRVESTTYQLSEKVCHMKKYLYTQTLNNNNGLRMSVLGFEFQPTDEEAMRWLYAKSHSMAVHRATINFILVCDIYKTEPWLLPRKSNKPDASCFYFSTITKIGRQIKRTAGKGHWHSEYRKAIRHGGTVIGYGMHLSYKRLDGQKSNWCMKEYRLDPEYSKPKKDEEIALYMIRNTGKADAENDHRPREVISEHSTKKMGAGDCGEDDALTAMVCYANVNKRIEHEDRERCAPEGKSKYLAGEGSQILTSTSDFKPTLAGFKFRPSDELAIRYLHAKSHELLVLGTMSFIVDWDVYSAEPWKLPTNGCKLDGAYFYFSRIAKLGEKRIYLSRTTGKGLWSSCGKRKAIEDRGAVTGQCLPLVYKRQDGEKSNWYMREFRLDPRCCNSNNEEIALCWIRYNGKPELKEMRKTKRSMATHRMTNQARLSGGIVYPAKPYPSKDNY